MRLTTGTIIKVLFVVFPVLILLQVWQYSINASKLNIFEKETKLAIEENAQTLFQSSVSSVSDSLERGEMNKFSKLLHEQSKLKGVIEFSLFDKNGKVSHSSNPQFIGKNIGDSARQKVFIARQKHREMSGETYDMYEPQIVAADCIRCHIGWKSNDICGAIMMRFSSDVIHKNNIAIQAIQQVSKVSAGIFAFVLIISLAVCFWLTGRINRHLRVISGDLGKVTQLVVEASDQMAGSSKSLADGASQQATSLEETSASLEEMSSMTKQNQVNAQHGHEKAGRSRVATDQSVTDMKDLSRSMSEMASIIKSIDEIAFQTNILALNAAVEAARAGSAGLGFAVVADEVRNLAHRSAEAARETAVKIEQGVNLTKKVQTSLDQMSGEVHELDELVSQITNASNEQSQGIEQISRAIAQVDQVTQVSAGHAQETANTSQNLNEQTNLLRESVSKLMRIVGIRS